MPRLFSVSGVNRQKWCRDGSSPNDNEVKPFPRIVSNIHILTWEFVHSRRNWQFAFSHASRSSESILGALQWLRRSFAHLEKDNINVCWIVGEMIDWLKVCARTVLIQESSRNSNYSEESNGWSSTAGWADCMDGRCIHRSRKSYSMADG
jgi:hypothetical protein